MLNLSHLTGHGQRRAETVCKEKTHGYLLCVHEFGDMGSQKSHSNSETLKGNKASLTNRTHKRTWVLCIVSQNIVQIQHLTSTASWHTQDIREDFSWRSMTVYISLHKQKGLFQQVSAVLKPDFVHSEIKVRTAEQATDLCYVLNFDAVTVHFFYFSHIILMM